MRVNGCGQSTAPAAWGVCRAGSCRHPQDQGIVEQFNGTLAEQLFGHQYAQEMRLPEGARSTEWVKQIPAVIKALNDEVTRLTGKKLSEAIKAKTMAQEPSLPAARPVGMKEQKSFPPRQTIAIFTFQVSWKVVAGGQVTLCGL